MHIIYVDDSEFDQLAFKRLMRKNQEFSYSVFSSLDDLFNVTVKPNTVLIRDCYLPGKIPDYSIFSEVYFVSGSSLSSGLKSKLNIENNHFFQKPIKQSDLDKMLPKEIGSENDSSLDLSYLDELCDGDEEFKKEMISVYLSEVPNQLKTLKEAVEKQKSIEIASVIHALRTKIRTFGILNVDDLSEKLEYSARDEEIKDWLVFEEEVDKLVSEMEKTATKLEQLS